jgi:hypothetical protein
MGPSSRSPRRRRLHPSADAAVTMGWAVPHAGRDDPWLPARAAHVVLRGCLGDVAWSTWPSHGRNPGATLGASATATQGVRHMIVEQLAPDADHWRELSCEPPVAERAGGRWDHHPPPRAPGPPPGTASVGPWPTLPSVRPPTAEHTPCRCTCICKYRSDKQRPSLPPSCSCKRPLCSRGWAGRPHLGPRPWPTAAVATRDEQTDGGHQ